MRTIRFRGMPFEGVDFDEIDVHIKDYEFVYGNLIVDGNKAFIVNGIIECSEDNLQLEQWIRVKPETVGQFTGEYDRVERPEIELYSGDIVKNIYNNEVYVIMWTIDGCYSLIPLETYNREKDGLDDYIATNKPKFHNLYDYYNTLEIIGNIHEKGE